MILHVICTAYQRPIQLRMLVDSFIVQTNPRWKLYVIHDGPASQMMRSIMEYYIDARIKFIETESVNGNYGHPNRQMMLKRIPNNHMDFVMMTNEDNYYVPKFVEYMLLQCKSSAKKAGMVYCDTIHSYKQYDILVTQIKENYVDMGSFIVRTDIARKIGFNDMHFSADGMFAEKCAAYCKSMRLGIIHIPKPLFVHN